MGTTRKFLRNMDKMTMSNIGKATKAQKAVSVVTALGFVLQPVAALASTITITRADGVNPNVEFKNGVADVWAEKVINENVAMNVFKDFKVDANDIANMYFKTGAGETLEANNLVNFVNSRIDINGTVNAIKSGKIGGNLFFLSSDGMAVGATGVINTGSLYVATPNINKISDLKENLLKNTGNDNFAQDLFYAVPINKSGTISVLGKINATNDVHLRAPKIGIGKNIDKNAIGNVQPGGTSTSASIKTGITNFADMVNIKNAGKNIESGLTGKALEATKTSSGDIVLSAYNSYNDNYYGELSDVVNLDGKDVTAELIVAKDAEIAAAGKAKLTAEAVNNVQVGDYKDAQTRETSTNSHLFGQIVDTKANVTIDGKVTGQQVDIEANAVNRYVSADTTKLTDIANDILGAAGVNLDASYGKLSSEAKVDIGEYAVIKATGNDTTNDGKVEKALTIQANSKIDLAVGASAEAMKLIKTNATNIVPAAGVAYAESVNKAEVTINGQLASNASTEISANANSSIAASAMTEADGNLAAAAVAIANGENSSKVTIGEKAKMADGELKGDVDIKATSTNSVETEAGVEAGEDSTVATAVNVTKYHSNANVDIKGNIKAGGDLNIVAENILTENSISADNSLGDSALSNKINKIKENSQTNEALTGENGVLGKVKTGIADGTYTPAWLKNLLTNNTETTYPWDGIGDMFSAGASIGIVDESNNSGVSIVKGVKLEAGNNLAINATSKIEDTHMNVTGSSKNHNDEVNNKALVNAAVLYANLQNDATVTIEDGDSASNVQLSGKNVEVKANSAFEYNRVNRMIDEILELCKNVEDAYTTNTLGELPQQFKDLREAANALKNNADTYGYKMDELMMSDAFVNLMKAAQAIQDSKDSFNDQVSTIFSGPFSVIGAAAKFADATNYVNFSAGAANSGKQTTGTTTPGTTGTTTQVANAGTTPSTPAGGNTGTTGAKASIAGSVTVTNLSNNANVNIGKNTSITATGGKADLSASSTQTDAVLTGKLGMNGGGDAAVGGTVGLGFADTNSNVTVGEGAKITASDIAMKAENAINHTSVAIGAGKGGKVGVNGMVSYIKGNSNSNVSVKDGVELTADDTKSEASEGKIDIDANNTTNVNAIAGAVSLGETAGAGASVAITDFNRNNKIEIKKATITAGDLDVNAETHGDIVNVTVAGGISTGNDTGEVGITDKIGNFITNKSNAAQNKVNELDNAFATKINNLLGNTTDAQNKLPTNNIAKGPNPTKQAKVTIAAAGSSSVNLLEGETSAIIDGAKITIKNETDKENNVSVTASDDAMVVAATGAAGISWKKLTKGMNGNSTNVAVAGAVAVNDINSTTLAKIKDTSIDNADNIINSATKSGATVAAGLGLALSKNAQQGTNVSGSASASVNLVENTVQALMENNKINKTSQSNKTNLTNSAFDNDIQITGGINSSFAVGGKNGAVAGGTVTYGKLKNNVESKITGGNFSNIGDANVSATTNMTQVGVAVGVGVAAGQQQGSYAFEGSAAYNELNNNVNATVENVASFNGETLDVAAYDTATNANAHKDNIAERGFDADGSNYLANIKDASDEQGDVDKQKDTEDTTELDVTRKGNVIVTGALSVAASSGQGKGGSANAAIAVSDINNNYNAGIKGSTITTTGKTKGTSVTAESNTILAGFATGAAGTSGSFGIGGSANWQNLSNNVNATIENSTIKAPKTAVNAFSSALAVNVAGQLGVAAGQNSKVGAGMAVAYNSLNNTISASVKGSEISAINDTDAAELDVEAANVGKVYSVGAAVGVTTGDAALNGVVVVNQGANNVEAVIDDYDYKDEQPQDQTKRSTLTNMSKVDVKASDGSKQLAVIGSVSVAAGSNAKAAVGGTVAVNEITDQHNTAAIRNTDITTTDTGIIDVKAIENSALTTISVGTAITTGKVAFSGAGAATLVDKETKAELTGVKVNENKSNKGKVNANANSTSKIMTVGVVAAGAKDAAVGVGIGVNKINSDTATTVSGGKYEVNDLTAKSQSDEDILAIGIGGAAAKTAGIAGNVAVNMIKNNTTTTINNGADINASGTVAALANSKDRIRNYGGAFGVAAGGQAGVGMGVAYNEISGDTASIIDSATITAAGSGDGVEIDAQKNKKKGLVVNAEGEHNLTNISLSGGVAVSADVGVGVAGTVTVNRIFGSTNAEINKTNVNKNLADLSNADITVNAVDVTNSQSYVGTISVGVGADGGVGAGVASDTSVVKRNVTAQIDGGSSDSDAPKTVNGGQLNVNALNKANMTTSATGVAAAGGAYAAAAGAGTVSVANLGAITTARVNNITSTNNGLSINAEHKNDINLISAAAAASGAMVSGAAGAGIGVVNDDSNTVAELSKSDITAKKQGNNADTGNISVKASNETDVQTEVIGIAGSLGAAGLNVAVNNLNNTVSTLASNNKNLTADNEFNATANNTVKTKFFNGSNAVGGGAAAVGVGVNTIDTGVVTQVTGSKIIAGEINVAATENFNINQVVENAALGAAGYSANVSVTTIGAKAADQYSDSDAADSDKKASFDTKKIIDMANNSVQAQENIGTTGAENSSTNIAGTTFNKYQDSEGKALTAKSGANASTGKDTAEGVQVKISGSTLKSTGDVNVTAERNVNAKVTSAQVAAGFTGVGAAASVAVLDVERKTGVTVDNKSTIIGKNIELASKQGGRTQINAYQVALGMTALSAAYAQNSLHGDNSIKIDGNSTIQATGDVKNSQKGTLSVKAEDTSTASVSTIGATAGGFAGGVIVTNATNNSNNTIGIDGSKLIVGNSVYKQIYHPSDKNNNKEGYYETTGEVIGYNNIGDIDIDSIKANTITATTIGGAVGAGAAQGIVARATDAGSSKVTVRGSSSFLGDNINLTATNKPAVKAEAQAYTGGLLGAAGTSIAIAKANGTVENKIEAGSTFAGNTVNITADVTTQTEKDKNGNDVAVDNVSAKTIGGTFGYYSGAYNEAVAKNTMAVDVDVAAAKYCLLYTSPSPRDT